MPRSLYGDCGRLPLAGVRVLDLTDEAVVLAPRLLADLGADVIRVESAAGDAIRRRGPFLDDQPDVERSLAHLLYNANKRSVALDLTTPAAWDLIDRLVDTVHVVVAPLEKRDEARSFFAVERFAARHPRVGVVDTVYRRDAPHAAVTDLIGVAAGGLLYLNGFPDDPPNLPAGRLAYKQASLAVALAAMTLVMAGRRAVPETPDPPGRITVCMQEAVMLTTIQTANENYWHWHGMRPGRSGLLGIGGQSVFPAADGLWVSFTVPPPFWDAYTAWVAEVTGDPTLQQECWRDPKHRLEHRERLAEAAARLCAALPRARLVEEGQRRRLLVLPVNDVEGIATDPHLQARGFFQPVWHPQFERHLSMPASPFLSSGYQAAARPAPTLGQHTADVLRELTGLDEGGIASLTGQDAPVTALSTVEAADG